MEIDLGIRKLNAAPDGFSLFIPMVWARTMRLKKARWYS